MATKIYISGKISGIENEAPELFTKAEKELQAKGFETVNPMTLNHEHDKSWHSYMKEDVVLQIAEGGEYEALNLK